MCKLPTRPNSKLAAPLFTAGQEDRPPHDSLGLSVLLQPSITLAVLRDNLKQRTQIIESL